ncbi:hypothetical protein FJ492_10835 [Mesorhizobium sp. B2-5-4]|uniref:hypothetical protein n=1 Tax=unclassified Mesorhizobium TaxID=325217 RepID=UPI00112835F1|nr:MULTISPECIES: hypothetical protein [unclassified Mesorhizobium]TPJ88129.1 hypothetical protein FJ434_11645 [Mesorhizobium sp. B2-5-13]TPK44752.1 hypothetical protein FJ492_10835 [Mesorhizobium sp. B2-5-4]TPK52324.1 hypothetical protein FJ560_07060 [Mesorhizobium sp. B2-5-5]TPL79792.1 hypothetical protein FJ941_19810 [Mesorhizobium sp. B2-3-13]
MAFTVIWYGRQGVFDKVTFDAEKTAKDHAIAMFQTEGLTTASYALKFARTAVLSSSATPRTSQ